MDWFWSMAGAASLEIDTTLLTVIYWGECRVSSEHFGQPYDNKRCVVDCQARESEPAI